MKIFKKKFKRETVYITSLLLVVFIYIAYERYLDYQPTTSAELVQRMQNIDKGDYKDYSMELNENDYEEIEDFLELQGFKSVSQVTVLRSDESDDLLFLQMAPVLVENQLKIINVKKVPKEELGKYLIEW
ncbi:hypothetical protein CSV77_15485 [Sporosarcina sp. P16b]|uniref:hypothetical protein n=1 Tax=Sporosarcina sp. P16b TaxID=2048261 RepID=UPI000C169B3F|nr:hypothetical protein [Sporosarcina sp. P16b]PIC69091.1 hypothetical protein CSV77_15485 [Sporosarcina sp. P16b]